jgi:hypothetical protein
VIQTGLSCIRFRAIAACAAILIIIPRAQAATDSSPAINFSRQVLPVLSDNCFKCHGPDEKARKAHLHFDSREGAFRIKDGKSVIVPGDSGKSELIRRLSSTDPEVIMPPPKSGRTLSPAQVAAIKSWVEQGARWETLWSLIPPKMPVPPEVSDASWVRNQIDRFIVARLDQEHLKGAPEAKKPALLRRITLDLTGLPPAPDELDAFLKDESPDAYEKVVDRLLASPRYGERMATIWLDLARYADTNGYQADRYRPMWPYRDWVIKAFNQNLPFDQFATWQLAGDLLPHPTKEQRLATAFNRLHMQNEEGGIIEEEYRVTYVVDRVDTFGTAFLGLTFECSRCHNHKFDPITQKDFYSLFAFFQNIDESGQTSYFTNIMPVPTMLLSTDAQDRQIARLHEQISAKEKELASLKTGVVASATMSAAFTNWLKTKPMQLEIPGEIARFDFESIKNNKIANLIDAKKPGKAVENPRLIEGESGKAAGLSGENGFTFANLGAFTRADPFSLAIVLKTPSHDPRMVVIHHSKAPIDAGSRGYELLLENGRVAFGLHHMWPGNSLKVVTKQAVPLDTWTHVAATYDGSSHAAGLHIYINGQPAECDVIRDGLYKDITYTSDSTAEPDLAIGYRFRDNGFKGGAVDDFRLFSRALTSLEVADVAGRGDITACWSTDSDGLTPNQRFLLFDHYIAAADESALALTKELHALRQQENELVNPIPEAMVMQELPHPKPAHILRRGAYDAPAEEVSANTPASLPPLNPSAPRNRLALAQWLFTPSNPLTARVAVNRLWQQMFGRGVVETTENFGAQGSPPTHPQLLDWLAADFRDNGWDTKRTLKQIAMSAVYRQSSQASPELFAADPDNRLLARGPSRRLTAEMLRDQALFDAGLLIEKLGGPSVKPYQPPGVWEVAMNHPNYDQGHGDDLHRRSLYTYWKRSVAPPAMLAFDAPDRNYCVARRQSTATPLQALALLNDIQITESARLISQRALKQSPDSIDARILWTFRLVTDRDPTEQEFPILRHLFAEQREAFAADPASAKRLLAVGEAKNDESLNPFDLAAGTVLAEALLNHDEAIMRR